MTRLESKHGNLFNGWNLNCKKNTEELASSEFQGPSTSVSKRGRPKKDFVDSSERSKRRIIADEDDNSSISVEKVFLIARRKHAMIRILEFIKECKGVVLKTKASVEKKWKNSNQSRLTFRMANM